MAGAPLVFNHIPKCAGTSLRGALVRALGDPEVVYRVDLSLVGAYRDFAAMSAAARSEFVFSPADLPEELPGGLVTGHVSPGTTLARYPHARHVTVLRHPSLRLLSQWVHGRALSDLDLRHYGHRSGTAFRVARGRFSEYLEHEMVAPNVDNTITRFLAWPHPELRPDRFIGESEEAAVLDAARERLHQFAHVGLVEDQHFFKKLGEFVGATIPETRLNERESVPRQRRADFDAELDRGTLDLLDHRTRLDRRLWSEIATTVLPGEDPEDVLTGTWHRAVERLSTALHTRTPVRPARRAAEIAYAAMTALRSGRSPWW